MSATTVCELIGPPAAGKSRLGSALAARGLPVVEEQLQLHRERLGPRPTTAAEARGRQERLIDLVVEAVVATSAPVVVVDVGVLSAVVFGLATLPRADADALLDHAVRRSRTAGIRLGAVCFVSAPVEELRRRAAEDGRVRRQLAANLTLTDRVTGVVARLGEASPDGVREVWTDSPVDVDDLAAWIRRRAGAEVDHLELLRELTARGRTDP